MSVVILSVLYPGITQLDFTGPHTVFALVPDAEVVVSSVSGGEIVSDSGLRIAGATPLAETSRCDVLYLPGGLGASAAAADAELVGHVRRLADTARYVTSACTGSLILGAAGLLIGRRAACHWAWRDLLPRFGAIPDDGRVVRDGNVITGGGVTAGIDFALTLAGELAGPDAAQAIQLSIEYAPAPPWDAGRPESAPPAVREAVQQRHAGFRAARMADIDAAVARLDVRRGS